MRELLKRDLLHGEREDVDGRTLAKIAAAAEETPGQQVVRSIDDPLKPTGGLAILRGSLAPGGLRRQARRSRAPPPPRPGTGLRLRDGVLRGGQEPRDPRGRRRRDPLRGPGRRPGHAGDAQRHGRARRRGPGRLRRAPHGRPLLRRDARPDDRPRRARGGARRPDRRSSRRATRSRSTSTRAGWTSTCDEDVLAERRAAWQAPAPRYTRRRHGQVRRARRRRRARARSPPGAGHAARHPSTAAPVSVVPEPSPITGG